ncbi:MAG TPA: BBP7 family outer membrane beta-barrel protein [Isosphaeraceae bacterium]|nr:BBP7 family outer membrane beta-barrel protein [Isosphaeraceae bacterium]
MRKGLFGSIAALVAGTSWAIGQAPVPPANAPAAPAVAPAAPVGEPVIREWTTSGLPWSDEGETGAASFWGRVDYLLWWMKPTPIPIPLATVQNEAIAVNSPGTFDGAIGSPGVAIIYGGHDQGFPGSNGLRLQVGSWLNGNRTFGIEASGFLFEQRTSIFSVSSDANGNPILTVPVFDLEPGVNANFGYGVSHPLDVNTPNPFFGSITYTSSIRLWGTDVNGVANMGEGFGGDSRLLAGVRFLDLDESFKGFKYAPNTANNPAGPGLIYRQNAFQTQNTFYGGQVGAQTGWSSGGFSVDVKAKLALGSTHQNLSVTGGSIITPNTGLPVGQFPGGDNALTTNIGRQQKDDFTVIPEVNLEVGYDLNSNLRAFVGYTFLYDSSVIRPGDQLDYYVNRTQDEGGTLVGPARPAPMFNRTDFFAHGVNLGLEVRY